MSPPKIVCRLAPMLPSTERERTTMPRTVPSSRTTRWPVSVGLVVLSMGRSSGELHLRGGTLRGVLDLEQLRLGEVEHPGENVRREGFPASVVGHDRVVVGLPGERDLVLRGGHLLGELHHVLVGLQ